VKEGTGTEGDYMKKAKVALFFAGIAIIYLIIQFQFDSNASWKTWSLPLSGKIIVIDAGHGGVDGGAVGNDGTLEKDIALEVALILRDYLQQEGALVKLTREEDKDLASPDTKGYSNRKSEDLKKRLELINNSDASMFLTLHLNAIPSTKWRGAQTFYHRHFDESRRLSLFIQDEIRGNLENTTRSAKAINNIYLLKYAEIPGALVEVGFLSNPAERNLLKTEEYQKQLAASIYQGILRYYTKEKAPN
jgi:N-acetylmuramoyl-L-alanine amidase